MCENNILAYFCASCMLTIIYSIRIASKLTLKWNNNTYYYIYIYSVIYPTSIIPRYLYSNKKTIFLLFSFVFGVMIHDEKSCHMPLCKWIILCRMKKRICTCRIKPRDSATHLRMKLNVFVPYICTIYINLREQ